MSASTSEAMRAVTHLSATATRSLSGKPVSSTSSRQSPLARKANMAVGYTEAVSALEICFASLLTSPRTQGVSPSLERERQRSA